MSLELDITAVLAPFEGDFRGGKDLRDDDDPNNDYRRIRDARTDAREAERQADLNGEASVEALRVWREVWSNGEDYLQNCGKDLEIVAYMIEASIRLDGVEGLAQSLDLAKQLVENYWGELLPTPDEDGIETTLLPLSRLNCDVIDYPLMRVPVTEDTSVGEFVVWQYGQARQLESMDPDEREQRVSSGAVTMDMFNRAVAETSDAFYQKRSEQIRQALAVLGELDAVLMEKAGEEFAPNLSRFKAGLEDAEGVLRQIAGDRMSAPGEAIDDSDESAEGASEEPTGKKTSAARGEISNRTEALEVLEKVAQWFERHEPQSILPSEIRKAKRRGVMTPEQLYKDLISDEDVRERLFRDVGIEAASSEED
ncbi:MAG: type VI secretion system protein TssA [Fuerstiella sp.]